MAVNKYLSIITLSVNGLNAPIKRHRVAKWIRKHDLYLRCLQETHLRKKGLHTLKLKGWGKNAPSKWIGEKKTRVAILISDKIDFKTKTIKRDTEGQFIILKGRLHQEDIKIINIYTPTIEAPEYIRKSWRTSREI